MASGLLWIGFMPTPLTQNDPENHKLDDRDLRAGRGEDSDLDEPAVRVERPLHGDDEAEEAELAFDDLAELDEDDLKNMEGPDA
ncbi:hypothetical protein BH11MYX3_BH11MYX3_11430 [soil metagenome]